MTNGWDALMGFFLAVVVVALLGCLYSCGVKSDVQHTNRMQNCIEAGGSWDNGGQDCYLPGAPTND